MNTRPSSLDDALNGLLIAAAAAMLIFADLDALRGAPPEATAAAAAPAASKTLPPAALVALAELE